MQRTASERGQTAFLLTVMLLAVNLRAPITGVGSLVSIIRDDLGVSNTVMGLLTTIPMVVFAAVSLLAAPLAKKLGLGRGIFLGLWFILAGELVRSFTTSLGLFWGTALLSVGIGLLNVLCVGLIKQRAAPRRLGLATSAYTTAMALGATFSIAASVPLAQGLGLGWRITLGIYAAVAVLTLAVWAPQYGRPENQTPPEAPGKRQFARMIRSPLAWQLTFFMGTQSLMFYCINAWWPSILQGRGFTVEAAALGATVLQVVSIPSTFLVPILCNRFRTRNMLLCFNGFYMVGLLVFFFAKSVFLHYAGCVVLAVGMGSTLSFCTMFYSLRTRTASEAAAVSGLAQSAGNLMAAVGPVLMGALFDATGSWTLPLEFLVAILAAMIVFSFLCARERFVFKET